MKVIMQETSKGIAVYSASIGNLLAGLHKMLVQTDSLAINAECAGG